MKRIITIILTFILISCSFSITAFAEERIYYSENNKDNYNNTYSIALKYDSDRDGNPDTYYNGEELLIDPNTKVNITFKWDVHDDTDSFDLVLGDIKITDQFNLDNPVPYNDDKGHPYTVTYYELDDKLAVHIEYEKDENENRICTCTSRKLEINFTGYLNLDPRNDNNDGNNSFTLGQQTTNYKPDYSASGVEVEKSYDSIRYENGKFYIKYKVLNRITGRVDDLVLVDQIPDGTTFIKNSLDVIFQYKSTNMDAYPENQGIYEVTDNFRIAFDNSVFYTDDVIIYTYEVELTPVKARDLLGDCEISNIAFAKGKNNNGQEFDYDFDSFTIWGFGQPTLRKLSAPIEDGKIVWTIEYNLSGLRELLEVFVKSQLDYEIGRNDDILSIIVQNNLKDKAIEFLRELDIDPQIQDIPGAGLTIIEENEFSIFDMKYNHDSGLYEKNITTSIGDINSEEALTNVARGGGAKETEGRYGNSNSDFNIIKNNATKFGSSALTQSWEVAITDPLFINENIGGLINEELINMTFTDTPQEGLSYVENSARIKIRPKNLIENEDYFTLLATNLNSFGFNNKDEFYNLFNGENYITVETNNNDNSFIINLNINNISEISQKLQNIKNEDGSSLLEVLQDGQWCLIVSYDTQITDKETFRRLVQEDGTYQIGNSIAGKYKDKEDTAEKSARLKYNSLITKEGTNGNTVNTVSDNYKYSKKPFDKYLSKNSEVPQSIYFQIEVNPNSESFIQNEPNQITLIDNMGSSLYFIKDSLQITEISKDKISERILEESEYNYIYNRDDNEIRFNLPDDSHLIVSYWCRTSSSTNDIFDTTNSIKLEGWEDFFNEKFEGEEIPQAPSSSSSSINTEFIISKYTTVNNEKIPLTGAQFKLEQLTYHKDEDRFKPDTSSDPSEWIGIVDETGYNFSFSNLPKGAIFSLTEIKTPEGYKTIEPIYFIFDDYDQYVVHTNNKLYSDELLELRPEIKIYSSDEQIEIENVLDSPVKEDEYGYLSISKIVTGTAGDQTKEFIFTITLTGEGAEEVFGDYGELTFNAGVATTTLKHGKTKSATGLPAGLTYTVVESDNEGYEVSSTGETGTIIANKTATAEFTNHKDKEDNEEPSVTPENPTTEKGGLTISKIVISNESADFDEGFTFKIIAESEDITDDTNTFYYGIVDGNEEYTEINHNNPLIFNLNNNKWEAVLSLKHGQTADIIGLPAGMTYEVQEILTEDQSDFVPESTSYSGTIRANLSDHVAYTNIKANEDDENLVEETGSLILQKFVEGDNTDNKEFTFQIELEGITDVEYGNIQFEDGIGTVILGDKDFCIIPNIPLDTPYKITELNNEGYEVSWNPVGSNIGTIDSTQQTAFVICTNTKVHIEEPKEDETTTPKLELFKDQSLNGAQRTINPIEVTENDQITYYITVRNIGTARAENIVVSDPVESGLEVIGEISHNGYVDKGAVFWNIEKLEAGEEITLSFTVKVPKVESTTKWTNTASAHFENNPNNPENDLPEETPSNTVEIEEKVTNPNIKLEKTQSVNKGNLTKGSLEVKEGDQITYYITVINSGDEVAKNITVTDKIPEDLVLVENSISHGGIESNRTIVWTIPELGARKTFTVNFTVEIPKVNKDKTWRNIASAIYSNNTAGPDKPVDSNEVQIKEVVDGVPSLDIEKLQGINYGTYTKSSLDVNSSDLVTYYLRVKNISKVTAENVVITDQVPAGLSLVAVNDGGVNTDGILTWTIGNIPAGETRTVSFTVNVPEVEATTSWTNIASTRFSNNPDGENNNITSNEVVIREEVANQEVENKPTEIPELTIAKRQTLSTDNYTDQYLQYDESAINVLTYQITVENISDVAATNIVVRDIIPRGTTYIDGSTFSNGPLDIEGIVNGNIITWTIPELGAHEDIEVYFSVVIDNEISQVENTARLTYGDTTLDSNKVIAGSNETPQDSTEAPEWPTDTNPGNSDNTGDSTNTPSDSFVDSTESPSGSNPADSANNTNITNGTTTNNGSTTTTADSINRINTTSSTPSTAKTTSVTNAAPKTGVVAATSLWIALIGLAGTGLAVNQKKFKRK